MKATATERYFDNGGETIDRYTIIIDGFIYGMSQNPLTPDGYNQYCGDVEDFDLEDNDTIGEAVEWGDLPSAVKEAVKGRRVYSEKLAKVFKEVSDCKECPVGCDDTECLRDTLMKLQTQLADIKPTESDEVTV